MNNSKLNIICHRTIVLCPKEGIHGLTITPRCERDGNPVQCNEKEFFSGTIATLDCKVGYKMPDHHVFRELICDDFGKWNHNAFACDPQCGIITPRAASRMFQGEEASSNEFPWHVGIYRHDEHICGGSIISEKIVLSAGNLQLDL